MRSAGKFLSSQNSSQAFQEELAMAQDCLKILNRKPFFKALVSKSACLSMKANLQAHLCDD